MNLDHFYLLAVNWNLAARMYDIAPAGGDGVVDLLDFGVLAGQWLSECL